MKMYTDIDKDIYSTKVPTLYIHSYGGKDQPASISRINPLNFISEYGTVSVILCGFSPIIEIFLVAVFSEVILLESIKSVITTVAHRRIRQGICFVNVI